MPRDRDWFRGEEWDEKARAEFARRLGRARRTSRPQYRRIKAGALLKSDDPSRQAAGRSLLEENLVDPITLDFERVIALTLLARHDRLRGQTEAAEVRFRTALDISTESGRNGEEEIELAELLLEKATPDALAEAHDLLE